MHEIESPSPLIPYLPTSTNSTIGEILEMMRRSEMRNEDHHNEKRTASRTPYDNWVSIVTEVGTDLQFIESAMNVCVFLRGRNLSTSGISVVGSSQMDPVVMTDHTPSLRLSQIFRVGGQCSVALPSQSSSNMTWVSAEVVRSRNTQADIVELGLKFLGRLAADHPLHKDAELLFRHYRESGT